MTLAFGCAMGIAQSEGWKVDPNWMPPAKAVQQVNPLRDKPETAAGGKKIYARSCAMCHGDEKSPRTNNAPDLGSPEVQKETDGTLFWRISTGNSPKKMPAFSSLPEGQRWQLVNYIREMGKKKQ